MINGFVGFQIYEDGTTLSVWLLRACTIIMFAVTFLVSLATFKSWGSMSPTNTIGLFVVLYVLSAIFLFVYLVMQILLVVGTLQDRWPLGHIAFGVFFFVAGQILLYILNPAVCEGIKHYMDGLLFATVCNLFAVMMVYKVRCRESMCVSNVFLADFTRSTGTLSPKRISSSPLALDLTIGISSRSSLTRTRREIQCTCKETTANTQAVCSNTHHAALRFTARKGTRNTLRGWKAGWRRRHDVGAVWYACLTNGDLG